MLVKAELPYTDVERYGIRVAELGGALQSQGLYKIWRSNDPLRDAFIIQAECSDRETPFVVRLPTQHRGRDYALTFYEAYYPTNITTSVNATFAGNGSLPKNTISTNPQLKKKLLLL